MQPVGQQRELDVLEHGLAVQRARMLEHQADAEAGDLVRRQAAISTPSSSIEPAVGRSTPMIVFITVDLPEPFGPMRPRISPRPDREADVLDRDEAAEALGQASTSSIARPLMHAPRARACPRNPSGKNRITTSAMTETMKRREIAERAQQLAHADQEDRADGRRRGSCADRPAPRR